METITGAVTQIGFAKLKKIFPHFADKTIRTLMRENRVDILCGIKQPSWIPERSEKAKVGGDFWLYRGRFGSCVGGRHPEMREETQRSSNLFAKVHQVYHAATFSMSSSQSMNSHELEFCPKRCVKYTNSVVKGISVNDSCVDLIVEDESSERAVTTGDENVSSESSTADICIDNLESVAISESSDVQLSNDHASELTISHTVDSVDSITETCSNVISNEQSETLTSSNTTSTLNPTATSFVPTTCFAVKATPSNDPDLFFKSQDLATIIDIQCDNCKCGKCPIPGMKYTFKEQQEFDIIQKNLFYDEENKRCFTEYPWCCDRSVLPRTEKSARQSLLSLKRRLQKNPTLAESYAHHIQGMIDRGAAVELSDDELQSWKGDFHYLSLLYVKGKGTKSDRIVFNAARKERGGFSFNDCLYKSPDRFMNNLLSVLLGFRNGRVAAVADLKIFHNQVHLVKEDAHAEVFMGR